MALCLSIWLQVWYQYTCQSMFMQALYQKRYACLRAGSVRQC